MNSTLVPLFSEFQRTTQALGAGEFAVYEVKKLQVIHPDAVPSSLKRKLLNAFRKMSRREIGTIFEELGADNPEAVSLGEVRPDRRELDKIIMGDILGLTDEEQLDVYRAVIDMVKSRIERAQSVENTSLSDEGINIEALSKTLVEIIDKE